METELGDNINLETSLFTWKHDYQLRSIKFYLVTSLLGLGVGLESRIRELGAEVYEGNINVSK